MMEEKMRGIEGKLEGINVQTYQYGGKDDF